MAIEPMDAPFPHGMVEEIERFLSTDSERPSGKPLYPEVFQNNFFFPLQRPAEMKRMLQIAKNLYPKTIMEIGTDKGGGLYHWCKCIPTVEKIIASEIRGLPYAEAFQKAFPKIDFCWVAGSSYSPLVSSRVTSWLHSRNARIDILFIDGNKGAFLTDFNTYRPLMSPTGIVFFHNINDRPPSNAYKWVISRGYQHEEIIDVSDFEETKERQDQGLPAYSSHENWLRFWKGRSCGVGVVYLDTLPATQKDD